MSVNKDYQGFSKTVSSNGFTVEETYKGYKAECETFMNGYSIGQTSTAGYGTLKNIQFSQSDGPFWTVTLEWSTERDSNGNLTPDGTSYGPTQSSVTVRMLSLPLQSKWNYETRWNYILASKGNLPEPTWWSTATNLDIPAADAQNYKWYKEAGEIPSDGVWKMCKGKTMPGVECWTKPIYELQEMSKHNSQTQAGWAISSKSGKIADPINGDFGIKKLLGGNWLCEGGSISYDGKHWIATCTYAHSPDGWDTRLYFYA